MTQNIVRHNRPEFDELHPLVYASMIGLTLWLIAAAWAFFSDGAYTGLLLAVVTGFLLIFIALPAVLWRTWRRHAGDFAHDPPPFRDWVPRRPCRRCCPSQRLRSA